MVDLDGAMIGQIILSRAAGHGPPAAAAQAELGYPLLPQAWGFGYAAEACAAALGWFAGQLPGELVVLITQTANATRRTHQRRPETTPSWERCSTSARPMSSGTRRPGTSGRRGRRLKSGHPDH